MFRKINLCGWRTSWCLLQGAQCSMMASGLNEDNYIHHVHAIRYPELPASCSFKVLLEVRGLGLMTLPRSAMRSSGADVGTAVVLLHYLDVLIFDLTRIDSFSCCIVSSASALIFSDFAYTHKDQRNLSGSPEGEGAREILTLRGVRNDLVTRYIVNS